MRLLDLSTLPLPAVIGVLLAVSGVILAAGWRLSLVADRLADVTGLGEAMVGAVVLGASTSLSGVATSVSAAYQGYPELAVSNAVGGIAAQTVFLAVADIAYSRANLEHAAASLENMMQAALLLTLLGVPLLALSTPAVAVVGVHPASAVLLIGYVLGLRLVRSTAAAPLWRARVTSETRPDVPDHEAGGGTTLPRLLVAFVVLAVIVGAAGFAVAEVGVALVERAGLSETVVGTFITAIATSTPELVTSIAAVRQGALTLAVGGIIGGNTFDMLFLAFADIAYRDGSIYHAITQQQVFVLALTLTLTGILLLGLLRREKRGIGNIGFEGALIILLYAGGLAFLVATS